MTDETETKVQREFPPDPVRAMWCDWLTRHGIDPDVVACPGWITRDPGKAEIRYSVWHRTNDGRRMILDETGNHGLLEVTHPVDGPIEPFPDETAALRQAQPVRRGSDADTPRHHKQQIRADIEAGKAKLAQRAPTRDDGALATAQETREALRRADQLLAETEDL